MNKPHTTSKLVVRNLSPSMTVQGLTNFFAGHGAVRSVSLATDVMTGSCRGLGFVCIDELQAGAALNALDGSMLCGRIISVTMERKTVRN